MIIVMKYVCETLRNKYFQRDTHVHIYNLKQMLTTHEPARERMIEEQYHFWISTSL